MSKTAITRAVEAVGSQARLSRRIGVTPQAVSQWVAMGCCPADRAIEIAEATSGRVSAIDLIVDRRKYMQTARPGSGALESHAP